MFQLHIWKPLSPGEKEREEEKSIKNDNTTGKREKKTKDQQINKNHILNNSRKVNFLICYLFCRPLTLPSFDPILNFTYNNVICSRTIMQITAVRKFYLPLNQTIINWNVWNCCRRAFVWLSSPHLTKHKLLFDQIDKNIYRRTYCRNIYCELGPSIYYLTKHKL